MIKRWRTNFVQCVFMGEQDFKSTSHAFEGFLLVQNLITNTSCFKILLFLSHNSILKLNLVGFVQLGCFEKITSIFHSYLINKQITFKALWCPQKVSYKVTRYFHLNFRAFSLLIFDLFYMLHFNLFNSTNIRLNNSVC